MVAAVLAAIAVALHRKKDAQALAALPQELLPELPDSYVRRSSDVPSQVRVIETLPALKAVVYRAADAGWSSPVTIDMIEGCYDAVDFLEFAWLRVAEFYPHKHFGNTTADKYIKDYVRERFRFHRKKHEPSGPGTGGTVVGPMTASDVVADMERLIEDAVQSIFLGQDFDFAAWQRRWRASSPQHAGAQ